MEKERSEFEKENDELLKFVLDNRFFKVWKNLKKNNENVKQKELNTVTTLELFITADCNLKCKYCYLNSYGDKLFPYELRKQDNIIKNLKILLNWFEKEEFSFQTIDLFSGEIWHTDFGFKVFDTLLNYIQRGNSIESIIIPTNCSFILKNETMYKMQKYIDKFASLGTRIIISCSIEGKLLEQNTRSFKEESKNDERNDLFYEKLFSFCKINGYLFHPMVSAANVDKWIDNLKWYKKELKKADYYKTSTESSIMMLEVRNDDWTPEAIQNLLKYYQFEIDEHLKAVNYDIPTFANDLIARNRGIIDCSGYCNYALPPSENTAGCSIPSTLTIRLGDLHIVPCHRTAYNKFHYGKFIVEKEEIVDIHSINPQIAVRILGTNNNLGTHGCDSCVYNKLCMKGCYGCQYENTGDPFMPISGVCKMFKAKINFLLDKYEELGVIDEWKKIEENDAYYLFIQDFLQEYEKIKEWRKNNKEEEKEENE